MSRSASISYNGKKVRVKCRWDEDLRFIWVEKEIEVDDLIDAIEKEYHQRVSIGQLKYTDPTDLNDLMTITKREDLEFCFEHEKPEIYIIPHISPRGTPRTPPVTPRGTSKGGVIGGGGGGTPSCPVLGSPSPLAGRSVRTSKMRRMETPPPRTVGPLTTESRSTSSPGKAKHLRVKSEGEDSPFTRSEPPKVGSRLNPKSQAPTVNKPDKLFSQTPHITRSADHSIIQEVDTLQLPPTQRRSSDPGKFARITNRSNCAFDNKKVTEEVFPKFPWVINSQDLKFDEGPALGGGYFGEVRKGFWRGIPVACKFVYEKSFLKKSDMELFEQEVHILSSLRHPNIILYMGVCIDSNDKIIVMEFMEKGSLHELLRREPLTEDKIHKIATEIALGMNYLHGEDILHRDLTSKNILLSKHTEAKVADFGLSKMKLVESQSISYTMGSVAWMAPEVLADASNFTKASDVYSYGIILWELFVGEDPCPREVAPVNLANKVLHENYRPPMPLDIPEPWQDLIQSCWQEDEEERPTFEKILQILEELEQKPQSVLPSLEITRTDDSRRDITEHDDYDSSYGVMLGGDCEEDY